MSWIDGLSWALLLGGSFFLVVGGLGLLRLPDFYTRIHAAGIVDTLGAPLILLGLCLHSGWNLNTIKMLLILGFLLLASATTGHALAKAAFARGLKPILHQEPQRDRDEPPVDGGVADGGRADGVGGEARS